MVIVSFSVFRDKLLDGRKTRTMRRPTAQWVRLFHKFNEGITLTQYIHQNAPSLKLQIWWKAQSSRRAFLFDAVLVTMTKKKLGDLAAADWLADGFEQNMLGSPRHNGLIWFAKTYGMHIEFTDTSIVYSQELLDFEVYILEFRKVA